MPCGGKRAGFSFTVADNASHDQSWIVKHGAEGMAQGISEFAAFVNGAGRLRRSVARNAAGKGKLQKQFAQPLFVLADIGIIFAVGSLEVSVAHHRRPAVAGPGNVNHVQVVFLNDTIEVGVDEILARRCPPMAEQHMFDIAVLKRSLEEWVVVEKNLPHGQVIGGAPIRVHFLKQFRL